MEPAQKTGKRIIINLADKYRVIDVILCNDGSMFEAVYKSHYINIVYTKPDPKPFYAYTIDPDGSYLVDGWFSGESFEDIIKICLENILTK
ncbi:MAG: hypothetical protein V4608_03275 [Bacteroidota bacterium]